MDSLWCTCLFLSPLAPVRQFFSPLAPFSSRQVRNWMTKIFSMKRTCMSFFVFLTAESSKIKYFYVFVNNRVLTQTFLFSVDVTVLTDFSPRLLGRWPLSVCSFRPTQKGNPTVTPSSRLEREWRRSVPSSNATAAILETGSSNSSWRESSPQGQLPVEV